MTGSGVRVTQAAPPHPLRNLHTRLGWRQRPIGVGVFRARRAMTWSASIARDNKKPCRLIGRAHRLAPPSRLPVSIPLVRPDKQRRAPDIARRNQCDRHEQVTMVVTERNKDEVKQGTLIVLRIFARFRTSENLFRNALKPAPLLRSRRWLRGSVGRTLRVMGLASAALRPLRIGR